MLACAERSAKIRRSEEKAKTNMLTRQKYSFDSNGKLANCESRDPSKCEIFIVGGRFRRRFRQNSEKPEFPGDPSHSWKNPERGKGEHG